MDPGITTDVHFPPPDCCRLLQHEMSITLIPVPDLVLQIKIPAPFLSRRRDFSSDLPSYTVLLP